MSSNRELERSPTALMKLIADAARKHSRSSPVSILGFLLGTSGLKTRMTVSC